MKDSDGSTKQPLTADEARNLHPDLAASVETGYASFSQLGDCDWGRDRNDARGAAFRFYYPGTLEAFQASHGRIEDRYSDFLIRAYAARTGPTPATAVKEARQSGHDIPRRARNPDFHFLYDLAAVPIGGGLLTRVEMLATDASRLLHGNKLIDCLDELYSKATDLLGIIRVQMAHDGAQGTRCSCCGSLRYAAPDDRRRGDSQPAITDEQPTPLKTNPRLAAPPSPQGPASDSEQLPAPPGLNAKSTHSMGHIPSAVTESIDDKIAMVAHDLDVIELKYLITTARARYFMGALLSTLAVAILVGAGAYFGREIPALRDLGRAFALVLVLGATGSLLSVIQRMTGSSLSVRYDLGSPYTMMLGALRPIIGAFGGFLVWLLVQANALANVTNSDFYLASIAFALGIAERSVGDVATQSGILDKLTPAASSPPRSGHTVSS